VKPPTGCKEVHKIPDGRQVFILEDADAISAAVVESVAAIGAECIAEKGSFTMCVPGGSIVKALSKLSPDAMDFSKVHVFFANERIGEFKCYKGAVSSFTERCGIPAENVHKVSDADPAAAAAAYEAEMLAAAPKSDSSAVAGMPCMDLILLGTGEDGHVGSLHPGSDEIKETGNGKVCLPIDKDGKKSIAISMDVINAARAVILSAAGEGRAAMVNQALSGEFEKWAVPAALVKCEGETVWMCDQASVAGFKTTIE